MTRYVNLINGVEIPMTEAEITARKAEEAEWDNNNTPFSLAMESFRLRRNFIRFLSQHKQYKFLHLPNNAS